MNPILEICADLKVHFSFLVALNEEQLYKNLTQKLYEARRITIENRYGIAGGKIENLKYFPLSVVVGDDDVRYIMMEVSGKVHPF
jgi:hypothetical protein